MIIVIAASPHVVDLINIACLRVLNVCPDMLAGRQTKKAELHQRTRCMHEPTMSDMNGIGRIVRLRIKTDIQPPHSPSREIANLLDRRSNVERSVCG